MFVSARFFALLLLVPACVHADGFLDMLSDGGSSHDAEITAQTLTAFFAEVNPAKAQGVAKLMRVYVAAGHTDELLKKLTAKYGEEPVQRLILGPIAKSSSSAGGSASTPAESPSPAPAGDGDAATPATEAVPAGEGGGGACFRGGRALRAGNGCDTSPSARTEAARRRRVERSAGEQRDGERASSDKASSDKASGDEGSSGRSPHCR